MALARDGSTALLNAPADGGGAALVLRNTASGWVQQAKLAGNAELYGNPAGEVALSDDGTLALLGGTQGGLLYSRSGSAWGPAQAGALTGTNAGGEAEQGSSVALAGDGSTALLGGPNDNNGLGAGWVFTSGPPPSVSLSVSLAGAGSGTISGNGINCPGTCTVSVIAGTAVNLLATPSPGSTFGGWSGACSGTGTCSVVVGQPTAVTASFVAPPQCTVQMPDRHVQLPPTRRGRSRRAIGVLTAAVECDQAAKVVLTGVITETSRRRHSRGVTRFALGPLHADVGSQVRQTLTLRLPRAALAGLSARATESLGLTLVASNGAGSSRITARAVRLAGRR